LSSTGDPLGCGPLRRAFAEYFGRAQGISCDFSQVGIVSGQKHGLELVALLFIDKGDHVAIENPGNPTIRRILQTYGAKLVPIDVDEDGLRVDQLNSLPQTIKMVYVSPSHQDPTGAPLSLARRQALVDLAQKRNILLVEDHGDSFFRYNSRPLPALQSIDPHGRVIFLWSLHQIMYPLAKLGAMVFPKSLVPLLWRALSNQDSIPLLAQYSMADFVSEGLLEKHIRRIGKTYSRRRLEMMSTFTQSFGKRVRFARESAGVHNFLRLDVDASDDDLVNSAAECGLHLRSLLPYYVEPRSSKEFLLQFSGLDEESMSSAIHSFAKKIIA